LRTGELEIWIIPSKGVYIATIKKTAPETDKAHNSKVAMGRIARREEAEANEDNG
jgi:hypothetical protein